jgi:DNA-binding response OmpR family regulator
MSQTIRVIIVSDQLEAVAAELAGADDLTIVAQVELGTEAMQVAQEFNPDVIVMDYDALGEAVVDVTRGILQRDDKIQVIMLSVVQDVDDIRMAMRSGARDYLIKPLAEGELLETIRWLIRERRDYARMSAFMGKLRRAYETMFYDDQPVPERVIHFLEAQVEESEGDRLTLEALAVAYARNRDWKSLAPLVEKLAEMSTFTP